MGKRLGLLTRDNTKCMLEVNGIRLIDRTLEHLSAVGVSRIVLVSDQDIPSSDLTTVRV